MSTQGLRERKRIATRDALLRAAQTLFREQGFEATTVREIAAEAQLSTRTFFRYFTTKDDIIFAEADERIEEFRQRLRRFKGETTDYEALRNTMIDFSHYIEEREQEILSYARLIDERSSLGIRRAEAWQRAAQELTDELVSADASVEERTLVGVQAGTAVTILRAAMARWRADTTRPLPNYVEALFAELEEEICRGRS